MRKLSISFLLMLGLFTTVFISCSDDDDTPPVLDPEITSLSPSNGPVGTPVTITGLNFGEDPEVNFGTTAATVSTASPTSITTSVPAGLAAGDVQVTVNNDGAVSDGETFEVTEEDDGNGDGGGDDELAGAGSALDTIEVLSTLNAAVDAAELTETLDDADNVTIFAPNNAAFADLLTLFEVSEEDGVQGLIDTLTAEGVSGVLQAHVVGESLDAAAVTEAAGNDSLETLNGAMIGITEVDGTLFANDAEIVRNIEVANGFIHVINSVINTDVEGGEEPEEPEEPGEEVTVTDDGSGTGTTTWTSNNSYLLDGFVFVNDGQTLTIEAGTVIRGLPGQGGGASALIVARGGRIIAEGTAEDPIIFTGSTDDLDGTIPDGEAGLWGGLIVLGNATTNNLDTQGENNVEGIPTNETRAIYGGTDDADDSGILSYVSLRHGGSLIDQDNEINGLTLGAVGSGTQINNVEVWSNLDDGIEFFGGTVNASNLVVGYAGDDGIDTDEGYRGNIQKAIVWNDGGELDSDDPGGMELDGGDGANETAQPYSLPVLTNLTLVYDDDAGDLTYALIIRDNSGASIYNSIIAGHDAPINFEDTDQEQSSFDRYEADELVISGNIFFNINGVDSDDNFADLFDLSNTGTAEQEAAVETELAANNAVVDPEFGEGVNRFTPAAAAATADLATLPNRAGLETFTYKGAVDPSATEPYFANWTKAWQVISGESEGDDG